MKTLFILLFFLLPLTAMAQFGVAYHQSQIPFVSLSYEFNECFRPEARLGTDSFLESIPLELAFMYDIANQGDYEIYVGIGGRFNGLEGLVIPIGLNVYPLSNKNLGVHIELAPIVADENLFRGSWGIRYRFGSGNE